jgi:tetratricopeptide (TPR) repeat protein
MATYKKRGAKKTQNPKGSQATESRTEEVFSNLDTGASRLEQWIAAYQRQIFGLIFGIILVVLGYLGYQSLILNPKIAEANKEIFQAQDFFEKGLADEELRDSLFQNALSGANGKYGFLDIIDNYGGTPAANLATYSSGMIYLHLGEYELAIDYLEDFSSSDPLLAPLALGGIGDAFAELDQLSDALNYYEKALSFSDNQITYPRYLLKAGLVALSLGDKKTAKVYFTIIKDDFSSGVDAKHIDALLGQASI